MSLKFLSCHLRCCRPSPYSVHGKQGGVGERAEWIYENETKTKFSSQVCQTSVIITYNQRVFAENNFIKIAVCFLHNSKTVFCCCCCHAMNFHSRQPKSGRDDHVQRARAGQYALNFNFMWIYDVPTKTSSFIVRKLKIRCSTCTRDSMKKQQSIVSSSSSNNPRNSFERDETPIEC